jgi:hypothetical protein
MSHIRYIKKNGKTYGPYTYNSIRTKDGKVKNIYLGKPQNSPLKSVVQKTIFVSTIVLVLFVIMFFLNTSKQPTGLVVVENGFGEQVGNYGIEQTEKGYDIQIYDSPDLNGKQDPKAVIKEAKDLPGQVTTKIGLSGDNKIKTEIFAINEELNFDKAVITLKKTGNVDEILHCQNFDFENFNCDNWEKTDIPFTDLGDSITFEVTHFTAYAGGGTWGEASNLTVWDDTDTEGVGEARYSEGCYAGPTLCENNIQVNFFANYTNTTGTDYNHPINTLSSNCSISFHINLTSDDEASWTTPENMTFTMVSTGRDQYEYNKSFNYRGVFYYNISCWDDNYDDNSTLDTFTISNSWPQINNPANPILLYCYEDTWCYFNFSSNCTEPDLNDADSLVYGSTINETTIPYAWFDPVTGNLSVYTTTNTQVQEFDEQLKGTGSLTVQDSTGAAVARGIIINVSAVNDPPVLSTIPNQTLYEDADNYSINLSAYYTDEEGDVPYFIENNTEAGSPLFINISYGPTPPFSLNGEIINASPSNNEVGNYSLNITVNDTSNNQVSQVVNFEVINVNDPPNLDWVCTDNDTNFTLTEDELFTCAVNATDDDMNETWGTENLTFSANETWFTFLGQSNNESNVSFTPTDIRVGFWWINITATDTAGVTDSKLVNITVLNVSDAPVLSEIGNFIVYVDVPYTFSINATDEDMLVPDGGESLNFTINETEGDCNLFNLTDAYVSSNIVYSDISFTPTSARDCWINFSVNDTDGFTVSEVVNISIRGNSAPNLDATVDNNATEDIEFYINLTDNATDADGDAITWSDNTTLFDIDSATGEINFTANDSYVGENWVNITVTDAPGASNSSDLNFTVENVPDSPNFTEPIDNHTAYEDTEFYLLINATDEDLYIPVGNIFNISENLTFAVNDTSLFDIIQDDTANATINFTATNYSQAGLYWFEINVTDSTGLYYTEIINITIIEVNDAPQFTGYDNITGTQDVSLYYDFNASDEENGTDTIEGDGNLTFWISNITNATDGDMVGSITLTPQFFDDAAEALNSTTGILSFIPNATHAATGVGYRDYMINMSVNDSEGAMASVIINLSIKNENDAPEITAWAASGFSNAEDITIYENDTNMTFTVYTTDIDGDSLTYNWVLDEVVNETETKAVADTTGFDNFQWTPGFSDAGNHNLTVYVSDSVNTTSHFWNITVLEFNSPPQFILTVQNISWNQDTTYTNLDLDTHFSDIENQTELAFAYDQLDENLAALNESHITVSVDNTTHVVTFTPNSSWYGLEYIQFHANDSTDNVSSNTFFLNVSQTTPATVTTTTAGGGGGGSRKQLVTIDIIHPGALTIYKENVITSPVIIRNSNKEITLRDINLTATTAQNLELSLSETHIGQLSPGEEKEVELSIKGVSEGFEEVLIQAVVRDPEVTDSAKIFITIVAVPKEIVEKIKFVKDLFKENPECLELNELLTRAEGDIAAKQYDAALEKVNTAIDKCKDLITTVYKPTEKDLEKKVNLKRVSLLILINLISITFTIFMINKIIKRRRGIQFGDR